MDKVHLIKEAISGNTKAIQTIYADYLPLMRGVCIKIVRNQDIVDDLVHDSFILALTSLDKLRNPDRLGEWLTTIVRNVSLKYLEKQKRENTISLSDIADDDLSISYPTDSPESYLSEKELLALINRLPTGYRQVLKLSVIKGFSHQEIANLLHIKPHSVSSQLTRAKRLLRNMILLLLALAAIPVYKIILKKQTTEIKEPQRFAQKKKETAPGSTPKATPAISGPDSGPALKAHLSAEATTNTSQNPACKDSAKTDSDIAIPVFLTAEHFQIKTGRKIQPLETVRSLSRKTTVRHSDAWQLLASGASGNSLMQHIPNVIFTDGNIASGSSPILRTWEEYAEYLESRMHDGMSEDSLTLIRIAQNNSGEIIEKEHHERPLTFGISLSRRIGKDWNLNLGLQYSVLKSSFILGSMTGENGNDSCYIKKRQNIHYIGLPLAVSYNFFSKQAFSSYASFGTTLYIPIHGQLSEQYIIEPDYKKTIHVSHFTPKAQWSLGISLGLQYKLSQNWSLYAEPTFRWYIPNNSDYHTIWTEKPYVFTVPLGLRFTW